MIPKLPPKIMVVEVNEKLRYSMCNIIECNYFDVFRAQDSNHALNNLEIEKPNIIVISSTMGSDSMVQLTKDIHDRLDFQQIPFIFALDSKEKTPEYKVDNSLIEIIYRPITGIEIITIIKSILRKSNPVFQDKLLKYKDLVMDIATYQVYRKNEKIHLGPTEFKILQMLLQYPETIFSRKEIIEYVWKTNQDIEPRTVDVHVNRLRSSIKSGTKLFIQTIRSVGYKLEA